MTKLRLTIILVAVCLVLITVGLTTKEPVQTGIAWTPTGTYKLYKVNIFQLQRIWLKSGGYGYLSVVSFLDWSNKKIYYVSERALKVEIQNAQSYRNLIEAAEKDADDASEALKRWLNQKWR